MAAYWSHCEREGAIPMEPANTSQREGDVIVVESCNGALARYRVVERRGEVRLEFLDWGEDQ